MKLVCASDSFKGSLSSEKTAELLTKAARKVYGACEVVGVPVADGGEGTVDAVIAALNGKKVSAKVSDPLMNTIQAYYGIAEGKAVIEMAQASGLTLVPPERRDPLNTNTYGTGELIRDALDHGCRELYIAIGGSATNDGGMGCLRALGARFFDRDGRELDGCGKDLADVAVIDLNGLDDRLADASVTVLCDVNNPLCGENGAAYTFAKQKGASPADIEALERGMQNYRDIIQKQFGVDCDVIPGAGAAGGLGAALMVFLNADRRSGIAAVLELIGFDELLEGADLVVTGEGRADAQSLCGKVMQGVGLRCQAKRVPAVGLCGSVGEGAEGLSDCGITAIYTLVDETTSLDEAIHNAETIYYQTAVRMFTDLRSVCPKKGESTMNNDDKTMRESYADEALRRWGDTDAYQEYEQRAANLSQEERDVQFAEMDALIEGFAKLNERGIAPDHEKPRLQVRKLQQFISDRMYLCTDEILSGLGQLYVADERFKNNIDKHGEGTAEYISACIKCYCAE